MSNDLTLTSLQDTLATLRAERDGLAARHEALNDAIDGVELAISALTGSAPRASTQPPPPDASAASSASSAPPAPKPKRAPKAASGPKVTAPDLVAAVEAAGGQATTAELVAALGVSDGRNLNGARRQAVDDGLIVVDDGVYRRVPTAADGVDLSSTAPEARPVADEARDAGSEDTAGETAVDVTDEEWESPGSGELELGRRFG